uniref:G protein-coupled receptor n=1 Tax=Panagrolaimus sp. JU765 TaxID=591449 RepID=A0AC34QND5_9BILA
MFALYWTVSCIPVNYIYRYLLICRNFKLNSKTFVMLVALFSILPIFIGVRLLILFKPSEDDIKYRPLFNNSEYMNDKDTVITFVVGNNYLSPMTLILGIVVVAISYSIVICTSIAITIKLRQLAKTGNTQMGRLQTEITWVLFIQALLPFLGFGLPILMVCVGFFFDVSIPSTDFLTIFSNYAPSLNALFTMFVVGPYRRKIASVLMPKIEQQTSVVNISNKVDNRIRPRAT